LVLPFGPRHRGPTDKLTIACAEILMEPSATRDRVTVGLFHPTDDGPIARLDRAFKLTVAAQSLRDRLRKAHVHDADQARAQGLINESEAAQLAALAKAVADVINVDDFAPEELTKHGGMPSTISPANAA
jgi:acyl-CoA dehydrogenase